MDIRRIINSCDLETMLLSKYTARPRTELKSAIKTPEYIRDVILDSEIGMDDMQDSRLGFILLRSRLKSLYSDVAEAKNMYEIKVHISGS